MRDWRWVFAGIALVLAEHALVLLAASTLNEGDGLIRVDRVVRNLLGFIQVLYVVPSAVVFRKNRPLLAGLLGTAALTLLLGLAALM